jgi:cysteine synthase B
MGAGGRLKEVNRRTKVIAVEPQPGAQVQGLRSLAEGFIPPLLDLDLLDGKVLVRSEQAFRGVRLLMRRESIFAGVSSGAVLHVALRLAERMADGNIVMLFADAGWKYLGSRIWSGEDAPVEDQEHLDDVVWW